MHTPSAKLDEEEHIQTSEPERLDGEEIARDHRLGMRPQELAPAEPSSGTGRRHPGLAEDLGDGARADAHTQTSELTDDPLIAPARVLTRKTHHQHADLVRNPWPPGSPPGIGPPPPHKLAMPAQQGLRTDEKRLPAGPAQSRLAAARKTRSVSSRRGRATWRRRTASSCRSTTISSSLNSRDRGRSAATASARRNSRYTSDTTMSRPPPPA